MSAQSIPLADLHRRLGATFTEYRNFEAPAFYSSADEEYDAMRRGCGLLDRSWGTLFEMTGEDRVRFFNGLVTCEVKDLEPGSGVFGFVTDVKGRVLADLAILALPDRLWLEMTPGVGDEIAEHIRKYIIVDRVELQPLDHYPMSLVGPGSEKLLAEFAELPETWRSHVETELFGTPVRLVREPDQGIPVLSIWVPAEAAEGMVEKILEHGGENVCPVGVDALERLRVEESRPMHGREYDAGHFPQETGYEQAVSYTKGCYLGQEVIARIHYRGGVNRLVRGLVFADDRPAAEHLGREILLEGRAVGKVTSAVDATDGRRLGLAMLHKRAEAGATVDIDGSGQAEVVALPFTANPTK